MSRPSLSLQLPLAAFAGIALALGLPLASCGPALVSDASRGLSAERGFVDASPPAGRRVSFLRSTENAAPAGESPVPAERPRLIFVHGTPGSADEWANYLSTPVEGLSTIAVDRIGFGASVTRLADDGAPERSAVTSYLAQAQSLLCVVNAVPDRPILIGHSLGGPIVTMMAALEPERIGGLVILAGTLDPQLENPAWYNYAGDWLIFSWLLSEDLRIANHEVLAAKDENARLASELAKIRCPVVVVQGGKDQLVPPGNVEYIQRTFVNASSVEVMALPDAGHFLPWEHEDTVRRAIERVLQLRREQPPAPH